LKPLAKAAIVLWGFIALMLMMVVFYVLVLRTERPPEQGRGPTLSGEDTDSVRETSPDSFVAEANAAAKRVERFLVSHGWEVDPVSLEGVEARDDRSPLDYPTPVSVLKIPHVIEVRSLKETGDLTFFWDYRVFERAIGKNSPLYDPPPKPNWTREKAISVATEYLHAVLGGPPAEELQVVQAHYGHPFAEREKHYAGVWHVRWARTSKSGYLYDNDWVFVKVFEESGPFVARIVLPSRLEHEPRQLIDKSRAVRESEGRVLEIMTCKMARRELYGQVIKGEPTASLKIVNPNNVLQMEDIHEFAFRRTSKARMAWVVEYATCREVPGLAPLRARVRVFIDAENGSFLGGDF